VIIVEFQSKNLNDGECYALADDTGSWAGKYAVRVEEPQGVQIAGPNTQHNNCGAPPGSLIESRLPAFATGCQLAAAGTQTANPAAASGPSACILTAWNQAFGT
jgi:hypothetical protein